MRVTVFKVTQDTFSPKVVKTRTRVKMLRNFFFLIKFTVVVKIETLLYDFFPLRITHRV